MQKDLPAREPLFVMTWLTEMGRVLQVICVLEQLSMSQTALSPRSTSNIEQLEPKSFPLITITVP